MGWVILPKRPQFYVQRKSWSRDLTLYNKIACNLLSITMYYMLATSNHYLICPYNSYIKQALLSRLKIFLASAWKCMGGLHFLAPWRVGQWGVSVNDRCLIWPGAFKCCFESLQPISIRHCDWQYSRWCWLHQQDCAESRVSNWSIVDA